MDTSQSPRVEIYINEGCPFCRSAKALLLSKGLTLEEIPIALGLVGADNDDRFEEMVERSGGRRTVPQIFINGRHIGGCDDLHALDARGELDPLLAG
jgi:glutaredoxin 3